MNKISLGLHQENLVIEQPNIDGIPPIASSEEAVISSRSPAVKRRAKSTTTTTTTAMPAIKSNSCCRFRARSRACLCTRTHKSYNHIELGDRSGHASLQRRYKDNEMTKKKRMPNQWSDHPTNHTL